MRYIEYSLFLLAALASAIFVRAVVKDTWSRSVKLFFRYAVPPLVFITLSFFYVLTGERVEDTLAKSLFCPLYEFNICAKAIPNGAPGSATTNSVPSQSAPPDQPADRIAIGEWIVGNWNTSE